MIILDASVLIGLLDGMDAHHEAAVALLERHPSGYLVHPITAAEVLVGPTRTGAGDEVWRELQGIGVEAADLGPDEPLILARLRVRWGLKMPDICVLATAERFDLHLATFDQQLADVATRAGRLVPDR